MNLKVQRPGLGRLPDPRLHPGALSDMAPIQHSLKSVRLPGEMLTVGGWWAGVAAGVASGHAGELQYKRCKSNREGNDAYDRVTGNRHGSRSGHCCDAGVWVRVIVVCVRNVWIFMPLLKWKWAESPSSSEAEAWFLFYGRFKPESAHHEEPGHDEHRQERPHSCAFDGFFVSVNKA